MNASLLPRGLDRFEPVENDEQAQAAAADLAEAFDDLEHGAGPGAAIAGLDFGPKTEVGPGAAVRIGDRFLVVGVSTPANLPARARSLSAFPKPLESMKPWKARRPAGLRISRPQDEGNGSLLRHETERLDMTETRRLAPAYSAKPGGDAKVSGDDSRHPCDGRHPGMDAGSGR